MLGTVVIILLSLLLLAYIAIPLLFPSQADPLPDFRDPITLDMEEERDALFRAIRELEGREDLPTERRQQLRARYEAKAAKVLRALDERRARPYGEKPTGRKARPRRVPVVALALLAIMVVSASVLGDFVLPRIGDATVTTTGQIRLEQARALQTLERNAERDPSESNLLALANAYWQLSDIDGAREVYERIANEIEPVPAEAYRRLGLLALQEDFEVGLTYLEQARAANPNDPETLFALGEVYFALGRMDQATQAWENLLAVSDGQGDAEVEARLALARELKPLIATVNENPNEDNLLTLGDAYWQADERERAAEVYLRVLSNIDPQQPVALSRIGQLLFFGGRNEEAIEILEQARASDPNNLDTLLFLGNAYFSIQQYEAAIDVWQDYVVAAGGEEQAGRVPGLIENARARLAGETPPVLPAENQPAAARGADLSEVSLSGAALFAANCSSCHGANGEGGMGPRLVGNARATDTAYVQNVIQNGRGMMPAVGERLSAEEITALAAYVSQTLANGGDASAQ